MATGSSVQFNFYSEDSLDLFRIVPIVNNESYILSSPASNIDSLNMKYLFLICILIFSYVATAKVVADTTTEQSPFRI
jgi:hypothetical protein